MDSWEKFDEKTLTPMKAFFSKLNTTGISKEDYKQAKKVWLELVSKYG